MADYFGPESRRERNLKFVSGLTVRKNWPGRIAG